MKLNNVLWEDFKKYLNMITRIILFTIAFGNIFNILIALLMSNPLKESMSFMLIITLVFSTFFAGTFLSKFVLENKYLIVRELEECESVFDIESVEFDGNIKLIANSPVSLTHEFTNALNDLYVSVRFKDLDAKLFNMSYSDYLRLDGKALVKYQKIKTLFNRDAINILYISPVA